jgi:4-amino-4-deoxy-L-arabinose transferase-like glycosyltransferase
MALVLIALLAWLPGFFTLPPLDRDEGRFAQASKQMLETGDFVSISLGEESRDQKPVGIYWLQSASTALFATLLPEDDALTTIWTYRIPSLLGGFAAVFLTFWMVRQFASRDAAFLAALLLSSALLLMVETKIAKTDAVLLASILAVQAILLRVYLHARAVLATPAGKGLVYAGWAAFGFGILVKGPIILLIPGATVLAVSLWDRDLRWLKGLHAPTGFALALAIVLPWSIAIGIATDGQFYVNSLGGDFAAKLAGGQEAHGAPPGYYTILSFVTFWPASLVLLPAIVFAVRNRAKAEVRFLLLWAATTFLMFEIAPTKLPHYVLPAYPALAALGALWLTGPQGQDPSRFGRFLIAVSPLVFLGVALALGVLLLIGPYYVGEGAALWTFAAIAIGFALAVMAAVLMWRGQGARATVFAALTAIVFYATTWIGTQPALTDFTLSPQIADAVARHTAPGDPPVVLAGYAEPSVMFLLGTDSALLTGAPAGERMADTGGLAVVEANDRDAFLEVLARRGLGAASLEEIDGINYSNGRRLSLTLYRVAPLL